MLLVQFQQLGTGSMHDLEILHQCAKKVKARSQKILGANSYICRSYRGKSGTGAFAPMLNRVNYKDLIIYFTRYDCMK